MNYLYFYGILYLRHWSGAGSLTRTGERVMALEDLIGEMQGKVEQLKELNHTVLFDLGDDGRILLDATGDAVKITPNP